MFCGKKALIFFRSVYIRQYAFMTDVDQSQLMRRNGGDEITSPFIAFYVQKFRPYTPVKEGGVTPFPLIYGRRNEGEMTNMVLHKVFIDVRRNEGLIGKGKKDCLTLGLNIAEPQFHGTG